MHVLVIGGTGLIGSWVVRQAVTAGHEVTVLHRGRVGRATLPEGANSCIGERPLSDSLAGGVGGGSEADADRPWLTPRSRSCP